ncbi:MAG: gamma-glutamyltransferase family protein [Euryarchaeota archaeon]|nr:gamma-glutamyltransferase family protein [Euryarchaeota archaeon]
MSARGDDVKRGDKAHRVATGRKGMVATSHPDATAVGIEILESGGNAFDAAVAAALATCVCEPNANGLGGQTMALFYDASTEKTVALDGSSRAPNRARPKTIPPEERKRGYKACTVPSSPAVYADIIDRYGKLPQEDIIAPSIRIAEQGYRISAFQNAMTERDLDDLRSGNAGEFFLKDGKEPYEPGEVFKQPVLAETLKRLKNQGWEDFYTGKIGETIIADMEDNGGLLEADDLAQIPWPIEREAEWGRWDGKRVASFPPAGAGRVLVQILHVLEHTDKPLLDPDSPKGAVALARNIQQALLDHRDEPRDPSRHAQMPEHRQGRKHTSLLASRFARGISVPGETSHLSVMDAEGNAVGITQSIEEFWGSCTVTPDLGFLYNNYIGAFEPDDPSHPYYLRPNAVPWSSVAPTIVFDKRKRPEKLLGSPGSNRISSAVAQVLLRMRLGEEPYDAVAAPRIHGAMDGRLHCEADRMDDKVLETLADNDWDVVDQGPWALYLGSVQMVMRKKKGFLGVADPRRDGTAEGFD